MEKIIIYTDGGSRGNPGPSAIGVVFKKLQGKREILYKTYSQVIGESTNNEAEYAAVIFAIKKAKALFGGARAKNMEFELRLDSQLVAEQLKGNYRIEETTLKPLFVDVHNARIDIGTLMITYVPREKNKEADALVNEALDAQSSRLF